MPESPQPISVTEHRFPQKDLGCTLIQPVNINTGELLTPSVEWDPGATVDQEEADERLALLPTAMDYKRRSEVHEQLRQEFSAWNVRRVVSGELTAGELNGWLMSEECQTCFSLLRLLAFGAAISHIATMNGVGATQAFKDYWTARLTSEL